MTRYVWTCSGLFSSSANGAIAYRGAMKTSHDVAARILFPGSEAENHYSVGIGFALPRIGIDLAYDTSRSLRTASMSVIARR